MSMRPKTKRRLILAVTILLALGVGAGALYWYLDQQLQVKIQANRTSGVAAYERGDWPAALDQLGKYITKRDNDAEALLMYGKARAALEDPSGKHLTESLAVYKRYLAMKPRDTEVQRLLLETYGALDYNAEAVALADQLLEKDPKDVVALKAKATALLRLKKPEEALKVCQQWNAQDPLDLDGQRMTFAAMLQSKKPASAAIERAEQQRAAHPDDPRFEVLTAYAYIYAYQMEGDPAQVTKADEWMAKAASRNPTDPVVVSRLTELFDLRGRYEDSEKVLKNAVAERADAPKLLAMLCQRLWQGGRFAEVVQRLSDVKAGDPKADAHLLALKALSLEQLDKADEAAPIADALESRKSDESARAWGTALKARFDRTLSAKQAIGRFQAALSRDRNNPIIWSMLGDRYASLNESELALDAWGRGVQLSPTWTQPRIARVRLLTQMGRADVALKEAEEVFRAAPKSVSAAVAYAVAKWASLQAAPAPVTAEQRRAREDEARKIESLTEEIQKAIPNEPESLPLLVQIKAKIGSPEAAKALIRQSLNNAQRPPGPELAARLVAVSKVEKLGMEDEILNWSAEKHGLTPRLAFQKAQDLNAAGKTADGMKLLQTYASKAPGSVAWQMMVALYKELSEDPSAHDTWVALGEAHPRDLEVQKALNEAPSLVKDREYHRQVWQRIRDLTGDEGQDWRLGKARWLIHSPDVQKDSTEAVTVLMDLVRVSPKNTKARLLLAQALRNLGSTANAIDHLKAAVEETHDPRTTLELVAMEVQEGQFGDAQKYLEQLTASPNLTPELRRRSAGFFTQMGRFEQALNILKPMEAPDAATELLRAELMRRLGRADQAETEYDRMMSRPVVNSIQLTSAAQFYVSMGKPDKAKKALARLDELKLPAAEKQLLMAGYEERDGSKQQAEKHYLAATVASPDDPATWRALAGFYLRDKQRDRAAAAIDQGLLRAPGNNELEALKVQVSMTEADADIQPLIDVLAKDPRNSAAVETLQALKQARDSKESARDTTERLKRVAESNPQFMPLQSLLVRAYVSQGRMAEATSLASRMTELFPTSPDPSKLAAGLYARTGNYDAMLAAARRWRQLTLDAPLEADLVVTEALARNGDLKGAAAQLQPYLEQAKTDPDNHVTVINVYARLMIESGRAAEARSLLTPLLTRGSQWRIMWMQTAVGGQLDAKTAEAWLEQAQPLVKPDAADELVVLGRAWFELGGKLKDQKMLETARSALARASEIESAPVPLRMEAMIYLAQTFEQMKRLDDAEQAYRRAIALTPDNPIALNNLAMILMTQAKGGAAKQKLTEARDMASKAVSLKPNIATFHDTLGQACGALGDWDSAIKSYTEALNLSPNAIESRIMLADAFVRANQRDAAILQLDEIRRRQSQLSQPLSPELQEKLKSLSEAVKRVASEG